jgi:transmembrane 9 superfamily protein 3
VAAPRLRSRARAPVLLLARARPRAPRRAAAAAAGATSSPAPRAAACAAQEVYSFYSLPYCRPEARLSPESRLGGLGEILEGNELQNSDLALKFKQDVPATSICSMSLNAAGAQLLAYAVSNHYWYQLFVDELPVWGMVGEILADEDVIQELESHIERPHGIADLTYLYTHKNFTILHNGAEIIEVTLTSEKAVQIEPERAYELTYSVHWAATDRTFDRRFDRYLDNNFFEHQIHWFSLFNSFMMVVFLCGLVVLILMRTLRADYARYLREEEDAEAGGAGGGGGGDAAAIAAAVSAAAVDDSGWKQVKNDVFRRPPSTMLFSALLGTGVQLILGALIVICAALAGSLYIDRGAVVKAALLVYGLTSAVSGFIGGRAYRAYFLPEEAPAWISTMLLTAALLPAGLFGTLAALNVVAQLYGLHNTLSLLTLAKVFTLWAFIALPLNVAGTIVGRRFAEPPKTPTRVLPMPRPIPLKPWYASPAAACLLAGLLPFGSIFIETYFIFTSFWNYKFYYVYGFMLAVFVILGVVVACVSVVTTYLLLNSEDHRWQWHAFYCGASPALYVFFYAIYYFVFRTEMTGLLQTLFYFGYTAAGCAALGILTGTVGVHAASSFVHAIYSGVKLE